MDGQFAVAAIHEDKEFHRLGAAIVEDGFQRGADRAPVNSTSSTRMTFLLSRGVVMLDSPMVGRACIVVQSSRYRLMSSVPKGSFRPSLSSSTLPRRTARSTPAPLDAQQYGLFTVSVTFHDLAGETVENAGDLVGMKKDGGFHGQLLLRSGHVCREGTGSRAP